MLVLQCNYNIQILEKSNIKARLTLKEEQEEMKVAVVTIQNVIILPLFILFYLL